MKILLKKVRVSYPNIFEARSYEGADAKFSATYLMDKKSANVAEVTKAIEAVAKEKWGAKADVTLKTLRAAGKVCLRDGDEKDSDGYEGKMFINASSKKRPTVMDADGTTPLVAADGKPYGGCYVNAYVEIWAMDNGFGKRVCASLAGVQFHSDGEPFGAGGSPDSFAAIENDEEESLV
jgi:hypothetical protein